MRALVVFLALLSWAAAPTPGDAMKAQTYEVWVPPAAQAVFGDAGVSLSLSGKSGNYGTLTGRSWYFSDGGLDVGPNWPPGVVVIAATGPAVCANVLICLAYDGGTDRAVNAASGCFCAKDSTCLATNPAGTTSQVAPKGITLPGAGWTSPSGSGCQAKPCGDLWTNLSDGGPDSSWPSSCPLQ